MEESQEILNLIEANRALLERIAELEDKLDLESEQSEQEASQVARVVKLLREKDVVLVRYALELQERNRQLQSWISTLRAYQLMMESDPAAVIGVNAKGAVVLYNEAAMKTFGRRLRRMIGKDVGDLDFSAVDPQTPRYVRQVLRTQKRVRRARKARKGTVQTAVFPLGRGDSFRGVLLRISTD